MPVITDSLAGAQPQASNPGQGGVDAPDVVSGPKSLEEWDKTLDEMTPDQISALLSTPAASLPPAGEIAEVIAPSALQPAPQAPPQVEPSAALESPKGPPSRVRLNGVPAEAASRVTQYLDAIRSGKSPEEASLIFAPPAPQTPAPADSPPPVAAPAAPPVSAPPPPAVSEIETRITEAKQLLEDAKASYDAVEISNHTLALVDLKIELDRAKVAATQDQVQAGNYDRIFDATVADLVATNPDLADEASPLSHRLEELRDLESVRNPGFDNDPAFLVRLVEKAKADVTGQPVTQTQNPAVQRHRPIVGGVAPAGTTVSRAMTKEEAESQFDAVLARMSPDEQSEFLMNTLNIPA